MIAKRRSTRATAFVILGALVAMLAAVSPSRADVPIGLAQNNLTPLGSLGSIRVRPAAPGTGLPLKGDLTDKQNPNRGVGDVPASCPNPACRLLGNNGPFQPAWDGHTHYHAGESRILISDATKFVKGDTILIGNSPNCNYPFLGLRCNNGQINEQTNAEVNYIVSSVPPSGPFIADLAFPLTNSHLEGERVTKLPTLYQGQTLRVEVPDVALTNLGAATVAVRAFVLLPGQDPADQNAYFQLGCTPSSVACEKIVPNTSTATSVFFIRNIESAVLNVGRTYSWDSSDDWYSVLVSARNTVTNQIVADGFYRFKVNPVAFALDDCDGNGSLDDRVCVQSDPTSPGEAVGIFGRLMDNSNPAAVDRNVEAVQVNVALDNPYGYTFHRADNSCWDSDVGPGDPCGVRVPTRPGTDHGVWYVRFGYENSNPKGVFETLVTGTYTVTVSLSLLPGVSEATQFDVVLDPLF